MDNYIVSARKYRPSTFHSVVGQKSLTTTLKNAIASGKLAHAYLFCGPRGVGKTTCARIFGKTINCMNLTAEGEACNECESCTAFNEQRSYNIHELDAASNNSVDDIRSLIEQVRIPPQIGKYKVYIIDEVHMLSSSAFNAFLKTLEEPPAHALFVLATTEKHKILPTILSRCQIYDFSRINISDIIEHLQYVAGQENIHAETDALSILAQKADGGMRDALSIFDQIASFTGGNITYKAVIENLNVLDYEYYFRLTGAVLNANVTECLLILNDILNRGFDGHNVVTGIASHFRDLMLCKNPAIATLLEVGESIRQRYVQMAEACSNSFLYKAIDIMNQCDLNYRNSRNKRLLTELSLIKLCQLNTDGSDKEEKKSEDIKPVNRTATNISPQKTSSAPATAPVQNKPVANAARTSTTVATSPKVAPPSITPKKTPAAAPSINDLGISISSITEKKEADTNENHANTNSNKVLSEYFTPLDLINAWKSFAESIEEDHHLKNTMINCLPGLLDNRTFEIVVNNQLQEQKLLDYSFKIESYLRETLRNTHIRMQIRISVDNEKKLAFTSQEKFNLMAEQNENLLRLKDEFGLELY